MSIVSVPTHHVDVIHDSQFDYYGQLLATCSSDKTVKIFSVNSGDAEPTLEANLVGHEGPVWMVAWAHPRFGQILASCSYDNRTIIWINRAPRQANGTVLHQWRPAHVVSSSSSVNGICWAPHEFGLMLATANSDGSVGVSTFSGNVWSDVVKVGTGAVAHPMGAMSVSFMPFVTGMPSPLLASAGCDGCVRLWTSVEGQWIAVGTFQDHSDWVRDVSFAPTSHASSYVYLASCAQDRKTIIRRKKISDVISSVVSGGSIGDWETSVTTLESGAWRLSWNTCGTALLVTTGDAEAILLGPGKDFSEPWKVSNINESK